MITKKGRYYYILKTDIETLKKRLFIGMDLIRVSKLLKLWNIAEHKFYKAVKNGNAEKFLIWKNSFWHVERKNIERLKNIIENQK